MTRSLLCFALVVVLSSGAEARQEQPDFSGTWLVVDAAPPSGMPVRLQITQTIVSKTIKGKPMRPFVRTINVERTYVDRADSETLHIGDGGLISGSGEPMSSWSVRWDGAALVINRASNATEMRQATDSRREEWSLDDGGRLRIVITTAGTTVTAYYNRF